MRQIRNSVFETNSSSVHSVSIKNSNSNSRRLNELEEYLVTCVIMGDKFYNEAIEVQFGKFGWEIENYNDQYTKLQYLVTMLAMLGTRNEKFNCASDMFNNDEFIELDNQVYDITGFHIYLDEDNLFEFYTYGDKAYVTLKYGYIDHQSYEDYNCLHDFINEYGISSFSDFIFNNEITLHTDNDNH